MTIKGTTYCLNNLHSSITIISFETKLSENQKMLAIGIRSTALKSQLLKGVQVQPPSPVQTSLQAILIIIWPIK